jgi:hypothetical protein
LRPTVATTIPGDGSWAVPSPGWLWLGQRDKGSGSFQPTRFVGNPTYREQLTWVGGLAAKKAGSMGGDEKQPKVTARSPDKEQAEELRRILLSDDIAPVDYASFGKRGSQIIQRAVIGYWRKH